MEDENTRYNPYMINQDQYKDWFLIFEEKTIKGVQYYYEEKIDLCKQLITQIRFYKSKEQYRVDNCYDEEKNLDQSVINLVSLIEIIFLNFIINDEKDQSSNQKFIKYIKYGENLFKNLPKLIYLRNDQVVEKEYKKLQEYIQKKQDKLEEMKQYLQIYIVNINLLMKKDIFSLIHLQYLIKYPSYFVKYQMATLEYYIFKQVNKKIEINRQNLLLFKEKFNANIAYQILSSDNKITQQFRNFQGSLYFQIKSSSDKQDVQYICQDFQTIVNNLVQNYLNNIADQFKIDTICKEFETESGQCEQFIIQCIQGINPIEACLIFFFLKIFSEPQNSVQKQNYFKLLYDCLNDTKIYELIEVKNYEQFESKKNFQMKDFIRIIQNPIFTQDISNLLKIIKNQYFRILMIQLFIFFVRENQLHLIFYQAYKKEELTQIFTILAQKFQIINDIDSSYTNNLQNYIDLNKSRFLIYQQPQTQIQNTQNYFIQVLLIQKNVNLQQHQQPQSNQQLNQNQQDLLHQQHQQNLLYWKNYSFEPNSEKICTDCQQTLATVFYENLIFCEACLLQKFNSYI